MPTPFDSSSNAKATFYTTGQKKTGLIEKIAVIGSATAIALFVVIDIVKSAPNDGPLATPTFRSADASTARRSAVSEERWTADESAKGTTPDASH